MSKRTTGRQMLDDLDRRVVDLESRRRQANPLAELKAEIDAAIKDLAKRIKSIDQRLSEVEVKGAETPPSDPPKKAAGRAKA